MGPWFARSGGFTNVAVSVNDSSTKADPYNGVEVKVDAAYACRIPMGFLPRGGGNKKPNATDLKRSV